MKLESGSVVVVHNLRNRLFLADHGPIRYPIMVSAVDIVARPYLSRMIRRVGLRETLGIKGPLLLDSGGFSCMVDPTQSITLKNIAALYSFVDADVVVSFDLPPTPLDTRAQRRSKWQRTMANLETLARIVGPRRLMPVVHGYSSDEINRACIDVRLAVGAPKIVGLGGLVPFLRGHGGPLGTVRRAASGTHLVAEALSSCRSAFPGSHLHAFGVGSPTTAIAMLSLGADSVDSLAWRRAAGFGTVFLSGCAERIISSRKRERQSRPALSREDLTRLRKCECHICSRTPRLLSRIEALASCYKNRGVHNVWTLLQEAASFRAARRQGTLLSFLIERFTPRHRFFPVMQPLMLGLSS